MRMSDTPYRPRCMHLCCKSMLVFGEDFENDPEYQAGMTEFWCQQTSKGLGPDGATHDRFRSWKEALRDASGPSAG